MDGRRLLVTAGAEMFCSALVKRLATLAEISLQHRGTSVTDSSKAEAVLGCEPRVELKSGPGGLRQGIEGASSGVVGGPLTTGMSCVC